MPTKAPYFETDMFQVEADCSFGRRQQTEAAFELVVATSRWIFARFKKAFELLSHCPVHSRRP